MRLEEEAERSGYHVNPDREFARGLARGLLVNEERYGYRSCPCRLASGNADEDRDIVCPCDYRDPDLAEHGACYCALYVTQAVREGRAKLRKVPERRSGEGARLLPAPTGGAAGPLGPGGAKPSLAAPPLGRAAAPPSVHPRTMGPYPVWRCRVCGYLCARDAPPEVCPICKATKDRFERFG
jgi:ferredoxin-thioredoxin reductase catalytic chain